MEHGRQGRLDYGCPGLDVRTLLYILFERNYVIRKAGKEDPQFMDKIKDYILGGELKAAIAYCRSVDTPSARMIEKASAVWDVR